MSEQEFNELIDGKNAEIATLKEYRAMAVDREQTIRNEANSLRAEREAALARANAVESREAATSEGAAQLKTRAETAEKELKLISENLCGVKVEGEVTLDMVYWFVEGQIDQQRDRADKTGDALVTKFQGLHTRNLELQEHLATAEAALRALYEETADYIRINHLGDVHHNQSMKNARDVLEKLKGSR